MSQPKTALTEAILTSEAAKRMADTVSPIYGNARIGLWLFQVMGEQWDEVIQWIQSIQAQAFPQLVSWSMDLWEKQYGIIPDNQSTLSERRAILIAKVRERAPMTPYKIAQSVTAITGGVATRIVENIATNTFGIYLNTIPEHVDEVAIRQVIDRAKPAHLIYEIGYEQSTSSVNYWGAVMMSAKKLQIRQVN